MEAYKYNFNALVGELSKGLFSLTKVKNLLKQEQGAVSSQKSQGCSKDKCPH